MTAGCSYIVVLFLTTAGDNDEEFGNDEAQTILCVYLILDVANDKVVALQQQYVSPGLTDEPVITDLCKEQTGIAESSLKCAPTLDGVIDQMEKFLQSRGLQQRPFVFCCDGQSHLRQIMHPEATAKGITLPSHYYKFLDLRKEFRKFYHLESVGSVQEMVDHIALDGRFSSDYGTKQCQQMAAILQRLIADGHTFGQPEVIKNGLEPGICTKNEYVDDETVVRARGLPWQSSDQDIAKFFSGLNVAKGGVALCLSQQGRRNGEALVRFECKEHRDLALKRHKHHLGQRYIEVYRASGRDFVSVAGGNNSEAQIFLSRPGQSIIRMRGLPYTASPDQVVEFFERGESVCHVMDGQHGVLFVRQADGRATGDAFVMFETEEEGNRALTKHRECIGTRYIELFKSTTAEVQQVLNRSMELKGTAELDASLLPFLTQLQAAAGTCPLSILPLQMPLTGLTGAAPIPATATAASLQPAQPSTQVRQQDACGSTCGSSMTNTLLIASGAQKTCIRIRGLPREASVQDILNFLGEHSKNIIFQGVHMVYTAEGAPSGEAFIQMDTELAAESAAITRNRKYMVVNGRKFTNIEVFQCSGDEINMMLGLASTPESTAPAMPSAVMVNGQLSLANTVHASLQTAMTSGSCVAVTNSLPSNFTSGVVGSHGNMLGGAQQSLMQQTLHLPAITPIQPVTATGGGPPVSGSTAAHKQALFSPGGTLLAQPTYGTVPYAQNQASLLAMQPSALAGALGPVGAAGAVNPAGGTAGAMTAAIPATMLAASTNALGANPAAKAAGIQSYYNYPSVYYWYPTPPVSPQQQSAAALYYTQPMQTANTSLQANAPCLVVMRGLPPQTSVQDVVQFFEGFHGITPECIQIQRAADGRPTGDALVSFLLRSEAERAIVEQNQKPLGNRLVELFMA